MKNIQIQFQLLLLLIIYYINLSYKNIVIINTRRILLSLSLKKNNMISIIPKNVEDIYQENKLLKEENERLKSENKLLTKRLEKYITVFEDDINNHKRAKIDNITTNTNTNTSMLTYSSMNNNSSSSTYNNISNMNNSTYNNNNNFNNNNSISNNFNSNNSYIKKTRISPYTNDIQTNWLLRFDGGSRGNPGIAGSGAVLYRKGIAMKENENWYGYFYLGDNLTNNVAEYSGLIEGLKYVIMMKLEGNILIQGDSELVIKQLQGEYTVKKSHLQKLHATVLSLVNELPKTSFYCQHIYREQNSRADGLSNDALDTRSSYSSIPK